MHTCSANQANKLTQQVILSQGTKLGPWLFILMINDQNPPSVSSWKYVDDTTLAEIVPKGTTSNNQEAIAEVEPWSTMNKLQLNAKKCKELIIDFKFAKSELTLL